MTKGIKSIPAMIAAHSAMSHTAKGQVGACHMNDGIINASTTKGKILANPLLHFPIPGKQIKCQGLLIMLKNAHQLF